jgi:hypothetical protein
MSPWNLKHAAVRVLDAGATASLPLAGLAAAGRRRS